MNTQLESSEPIRVAKSEYERIGPEHPFHHMNLAASRAERAAKGEHEHAREVIEAFIFAVASHSERTWAARCSGMTYLPYTQHIANALQQLLDDPKADARVALGLKSSRPGRRKGTVRGFDYKAVSAARELLRAYRCQSFMPTLEAWTQKAATRIARQGTTTAIAHKRPVAIRVGTFPAAGDRQ